MDMAEKVESSVVGEKYDFVCSGCNKTAKVSLKKPGKMTIKCICGKKKIVEVRRRDERRRAKRIQVQLTGTIVVNEKRKGIVINDLSLKGVNIASFGLSLDVGDMVEVVISYVDKEEVRIRSEAIVRNLRGGSIGLEFHRLRDFTEDAKKLGFYLLSLEE